MGQVWAKFGSFSLFLMETISQNRRASLPLRLPSQEVSLQNEANTWLTSKDAMAATDSNGNNGISAAGKAAVDAGDIPTDASADWSAVNLYRKAQSKELRMFLEELSRSPPGEDVSLFPLPVLRLDWCKGPEPHLAPI